MEADDRQVTTVSQSNRHSTIGTRQTEYQEVLPSSANVQSHLTLSFADDGNALWYSVCRMPMVEWRLDCVETVVTWRSSASMIPAPGVDSRTHHGEGEGGGGKGDFSGSSHTSDLKIDTPLATLPGAWRYRLNAETGSPGVSIL